MKRYFIKTGFFALMLCCINILADGQSIHFSQYYNAPMLLNPANTGLLQTDDYRIGTNYRNQWAAIPVPYSTFSAFGDFQVFHGETSNNWLGIGAAIFNDKAGNGNLSLTRSVLSVAYHLGLNDNSMLSLGLQGGYVQRSVDYSSLTFDSQWDGFSFNSSLPNTEKNYVQSLNYYDVGAGLNYAYYPNDNVYIKVGAGVANINQPKESFYGMDNTIKIRPTGNIDALFKINSKWIINPSIYYTAQSGAYELVGGSLARIYLTGEGNNATELILGAYYRVNESIIGVAGVKWGGLSFTVSYDNTVSSLAPYTSGNGAIEFSLIYMGSYHSFSSGQGRRTYNCPRFF